MSRYTAEELEQLKQSIDLAALIQSKGILLEKHGSKDLKGLCPFHNDRNPSLIVTPGKQLFNCLSCGTGGDVIAFVQKYEGLSFTHAVELIRSRSHSELYKASPPLKSSRARRLRSPVKLDSGHYELLHECVDFYHKTLLESPAALDYLKKRGLDCPDLIKTFKVGFANRTLGLRLPDKSRGEGREIRRKLEEAGLFRAESGHEHFNGSVIFPVFDENNRITEIYARKVRDNLRKGTVYHLYLPGPHKGIFNRSCLQCREIILCEAVIDALTFWRHGFRNVTASYGTGGFTDDHLKSFIEYAVQKVYIAYDADASGDKAAEELAVKLNGEGMQCFRVKLPRGTDINSFALQAQKPEQALQQLLFAAQIIGSQLAVSASCATVEVQNPCAESPDTSRKQEADSSPRCVNVPHSQCGDDHLFTLGNRLYRVRGLERNSSFDVLKINLRLSINPDETVQGPDNMAEAARFYLDTFDFYNARHRKSFMHAAADECRLEAELVKRDLGRILLKLEELQESSIKKVLEVENDTVKLSEEEKAEALALLQAPDLIRRIIGDFRLTGLVGENSNALISYLAAVSRKTDDPLAVIIQSSSSAGKSAVMDAALAFMPHEELIRYTSMTGQSLFYMGETSLKHKILAISEEEGAEQATYALKILQSEKHLKIASTGKDPKSGRLITQEYSVEGPCVIFMTTTNVEVDEELQNRCLVLSVNEDREQTRRIHQRQRESRTLEGLMRKEDKKKTLHVHRNAQRLLQPLTVVNPYAEQLTFLDSRLRTRRDHIKYLNIINSITLLHQYQRTVKKLSRNGKILEYIEVTPEDIDTANRLVADIMGTSLDELAPQTRKLLEMICELAKERCKEENILQEDLRLKRREIRRYTGWSDSRLRIHLQRLAEMEYLHLARGSQGKTCVYELLYKGEGNDGGNFALSLINTATISTSQGKNGTSQGLRRAFAAASQGCKNDIIIFKQATNE